VLPGRGPLNPQVGNLIAHGGTGGLDSGQIRRWWIVRRPGGAERAGPGGRRLQAEMTSARDQVEAALLATFTPEEQHQLRDLLSRLASSDTATGSCI